MSMTPQPSRSSQPGGTVVVVDDEQMVAAALQTFLELATPHRVLAFTSPRKALDALSTDIDPADIDVVIADFMMPELDGITFLERVREAFPHVSRVLLTGYADAANAIRAINEAGVYYYLEKPWDGDHLKLVVRNGVERATLIKDLEARIAALEHANEELLAVRERLIRMFL
jgi:putative two-component system response regulator